MEDNGNTTSTDQQQLTIRISRSGGIVFSALDADSDTMVKLDQHSCRNGVSLPVSLREALADSMLVSARFDEALVLTDTPVMLTPLEEYNPSAVEPLYNYTFTGYNDSKIISGQLRSLNAVASFAASKDLLTVVSDHFKSFRLIPICQPVWQHLYRQSRPGLSRKLYGYFHDHKMDVFSYGKNRFDYENSFETVHAHDALYYLLYVWKQLGMSEENDELHIVGQMPSEDWLQEHLRLYLHRVYVGRPSAEFNRHPLTAMPGMTYDLLTLYLGEEL